MEAAGKGVKSLIMCVLVLGLVLEQEHIQVEAKAEFSPSFPNSTPSYSAPTSYSMLGCVPNLIPRTRRKSCCPSTTARNIYNPCRFAGGSRETCARLSGCKIVDGTCKPPYVHHTLHPDSEESDVLDFCKLGCTSSVCSNIRTFAGNEEGNAAVDRCNDACYRFCTKDAETVTVVS